MKANEISAMAIGGAMESRYQLGSRWLDSALCGPSRPALPFFFITASRLFAVGQIAIAISRVILNGYEKSRTPPRGNVRPGEGSAMPGYLTW